jgi:hypothetical protein
MRLIAANSLADTEIVDRAGRSVGRIVDFMLDTEAGRMVYGVLAVGGVLGVGEKWLAVPALALELDVSQDRLVLTVDPALLDEASGFDHANPPEYADLTLHAEAVRARAARPAL